MPLDFNTMLQGLLSTGTDEDMMFIANMLWSLWKAKNKELFEGQRMNPRSIAMQAETLGLHMPTGIDDRPAKKTLVHHIKPQHEILLVDASWDVQQQAGVGILWYDTHRQLKEIKLSSFTTGDAFHAETMGVWQAALACQSDNGRDGTTGYTIFTDCQVLVKQINVEDNQETHSWGAREAILQLRVLTKQAFPRIIIEYANREQLHTVHLLANVARRQRINYQGPSISAAWQLGTMQHELDHNSIRIIRDDGG
jgi:ribonuclease HI